MNPKITARLMQSMASGMLNDSCGIDDDEIEHALDELDKMQCGVGHDEMKKVVERLYELPQEKRMEIIEKFVDRKIGIEQICQRYGITRATLNRWQRKGKLPSFRKDCGGKDYLFTGEADEWVRRWENNH